MVSGVTVPGCLKTENEKTDYHCLIVCLLSKGRLQDLQMDALNQSWDGIDNSQRRKGLLTGKGNGDKWQVRMDL